MPAPRKPPPSAGPSVPPDGGAEERLRRSEEHFRTVFDHAPIGILLLGPDTRILRANHALCALLGYEEPALMGRRAAELLHPDDRPESERMRARVESGEVDHIAVERRALRKDGRVLWMQVRSTVHRNADRAVELIITQLMDVTEHRTQEQKLRESEARLRTIFEQAPIGIAVIAPPGELLQANRALATMLGRTMEDLERRTVPEIVHPDDVAAIRAKVEAALALGPDTFSGESRYLRPDGEIVWGAYHSTLIRDRSGAPRYFIAQVIDVSERRLAEEALLDSEARYRGLVELSQDLIVRMDVAGNLTFVNDAWCAKFGRTREQVIGASVMPRILPVDQDVAQQALHALTVEPHRVRVEIRQLTVEGIRWMEWEGCAIFDDAGRVAELQAIGRDITQDHEVAEALRASEARYRGVVESQQAVVLRMDLDRRITFVNDYGSRLLGVARAEIVGSDVLDWVYPEDRDATRTALESELAPPHRASLDCRVEIAGEIRWFEWEGTMILDEHGMPVELQSVGFDVTERRAAADALRASLEELRQSEEKLRLLAQRQVAVREEERKRLGFDLHDGVCQELIGIGILVESARHRYGLVPGDSPGELARVGRYLSEVVEHLRQLAGELRPMLLHDLGLEGSLRSLALGLANETTQIQTVFPTPVPRLEEAAEVGVYRIAQEALTNALRHGRARVVELRLAPDGVRLRLEVRDDGCGFDPSRRRTTALGLLSMEERALALGGRLEVTSVPGEGTTIVLDCPLAARSRASAA
jgi:PAS domain S-box-containing protein